MLVVKTVLYFKTILFAVIGRFFDKRNFLKIKKKSDFAIILGNGPSINKDVEEIEKLIKECPGIDVFAVNSFPLSDLFQKIKPRFLVLTAPAFWSSEAEGFYLDIRNKLMSVLQTLSRQGSNLEVIIPTNARRNNGLSGWYERLFGDVWYYNVIGNKFGKLGAFFFKDNIFAPAFQNVLAASLYIAITLKYKKIYIYGADHSWHEELKLDAQNRLLVGNQHFYDQKQFICYPSDIKSRQSFKLKDFFGALAIMHESYEVLNKYAEENDVEVLNNSMISYIDSFKRG